MKTEIAQLRAAVEHLSVSIRAIDAGRIEGARTDGEFGARIEACEGMLDRVLTRLSVIEVESARRKIVPTPQTTAVSTAQQKTDPSVEVEKTRVILGAIPGLIKALLAGGVVTAAVNAGLKIIEKVREAINK